MEPVSSSDLRLELTIGQAPDTAAMIFEGSRSMVWVMKSLTAGHWIPAPSCSALSLGLVLMLPAPPTPTRVTPSTGFHGERRTSTAS